MKRFLAFTVAAVIATVFSADVFAGPMSALNALTPDGKIDVFVDDDYETAFDGSNGYQVGDIFVGIFEIQHWFSSPSPSQVNASTDTFTGFLIAKVASVGVVSGDPTFTFTNLSNAEYSAFKTANGFTNLPARNNQLSALIVYDDATKNPGGPGTFINPDGATGLNDAFATVEDQLVFEFGFNGSAVAQAWLTGATLNFAMALNATYIDPVVPSWQFGDVVGVATNAALLPAADLQLEGKTVAIGPKGDFALKTQSTLYVNPVPEPGSMMLFGFGALGLLGGAKLRRRNAA